MQSPEIDKRRFRALIDVRAATLESLRSILRGDAYTEITTASLVNIAGSCENPNASFTLNYYGRDAHLSQSAQLQLEQIVVQLGRVVFTVNSSFRAEDFLDPDNSSRRLSEFTLVEPEKPYSDIGTDAALEDLTSAIEEHVKRVTAEVLEHAETPVSSLGGNCDFLRTVIGTRFARITYDEGVRILRSRGSAVSPGEDLGIRDERALLEHFGNIPTFVSYHPAQIKFFNIKRRLNDDRALSVDLLLPPLGEAVGGAIREQDGKVITEQLLSSKIASYVETRGGSVLAEFREYLSLFDKGDAPLRGGYGIGFERFIAFLLNTTDILDTLSFQPMGRP
jgi:asparaginyl-tRNA synthetase